MEIIVSGRHLSVGNDLKEYAENKILAILENKPLKVSTVRVVLDIEKNRQKAEVIVNLKNLVVEADEETYDMYDSIDKVADKIQKQLKKHLDKMQDHRKRSSSKALIVEDEALSELEEEYEDIS